VQSIPSGDQADTTMLPAPIRTWSDHAWSEEEVKGRHGFSVGGS
jgi:hypothetical protein